MNLEKLNREFDNNKLATKDPEMADSYTYQVGLDVIFFDNKGRDETSTIAFRVGGIDSQGEIPIYSMQSMEYGGTIHVIGNCSDKILFKIHDTPHDGFTSFLMQIKGDDIVGLKFINLDGSEFEVL